MSINTPKRGSDSNNFLKLTDSEILDVIENHEIRAFLDLASSDKYHEVTLKFLDTLRIATTKQQLTALIESCRKSGGSDKILLAKYKERASKEPKEYFDALMDKLLSNNAVDKLYKAIKAVEKYNPANCYDAEEKIPIPPLCHSETKDFPDLSLQSIELTLNQCEQLSDHIDYKVDYMLLKRYFEVRSNTEKYIRNTDETKLRKKIRSQVEQSILDEKNKREQAEKKVQGEEQKRLDAEQKMLDAESKAKEEQQKRSDAENKARDEEVKRLDAEQKMLDAESKAKEEQQKRSDAENKAKEEQQKRSDAENKAKDEEVKRLDAESRTKEEENKRMEAENKAKDEEKKRLDAENRVVEESSGRMNAEIKAKEEERKRLDADDNLRSETLKKTDAELKLKSEKNVREKAENEAKDERQKRLDIESRLEKESGLRIDVEGKLKKEQEKRTAIENQLTKGSDLRAEAENEAKNEREKRADVEDKLKEEQKNRITAESKFADEEKKRELAEGEVKDKKREILDLEQKIIQIEKKRLEIESTLNQAERDKAELEGKVIQMEREKLKVQEEEEIKREEKRLKLEAEAAEDAAITTDPHGVLVPVLHYRTKKYLAGCSLMQIQREILYYSNEIRNFISLTSLDFDQQDTLENLKKDIADLDKYYEERLDAEPIDMKDGSSPGEEFLSDAPQERPTPVEPPFRHSFMSDLPPDNEGDVNQAMNDSFGIQNPIDETAPEKRRFIPFTDYAQIQHWADPNYSIESCEEDCVIFQGLIDSVKQNEPDNLDKIEKMEGDLVVMKEAIEGYKEDEAKELKAIIDEVFKPEPPTSEKTDVSKELVICNDCSTTYDKKLAFCTCCGKENATHPVIVKHIQDLRDGVQAGLGTATETNAQQEQVVDDEKKIKEEADKHGISVEQWRDLLHLVECCNQPREWADEAFTFPGNGKIETREFLNIRRRPELTRLPKGFIVRGGLNLNNCVALASLPEGLEIEGDLRIPYCKSLISLPKDIKVGGDIIHTSTPDSQLSKDIKEWYKAKIESEKAELEAEAAKAAFKSSTASTPEPELQKPQQATGATEEEEDIEELQTEDLEEISDEDDIWSGTPTEKLPSIYQAKTVKKGEYLVISVLTAGWPITVEGGAKVRIGMALPKSKIILLGEKAKCKIDNDLGANIEECE